MKKYAFQWSMGLMVAALAFTSCQKEKKVVATPDYSFTEEFDTVSVSIQRGWFIKNNSQPMGIMAWGQANHYLSYYNGKADDYIFGSGFAANTTAYSGNNFIMATSDCGSGTAQISCWLVSPEFMAKDGDKISFFTRTYETPAVAADNLQVRLNAVGSSTNVGNTNTSVGDFTKMALEVNPGLTLTAFPGTWTKYTITIDDMPVARKTRVAFRYVVPNGGPTGPNGLGVGIDDFSFESN